MRRLKPLLISAGIVMAIVSLVRNRLSEPAAADPGGWKPVEPS